MTRSDLSPFLQVYSWHLLILCYRLLRLLFGIPQPQQSRCGFANGGCGCALWHLRHNNTGDRSEKRCGQRFRLLWTLSRSSSQQTGLLHKVVRTEVNLFLTDFLQPRSYFFYSPYFSFMLGCFFYLLLVDYSLYFSSLYLKACNFMSLYCISNI